MKYKLLCAFVGWVLLSLGGHIAPAEGLNLDTDPYNIEAFFAMAENEPTKVCHYITCLENESPSTCPEGTTYMEGVTQYGCCGGCVKFKQNGDDHCTGSRDPNFGGGYDDLTKSDSKIVAASFADSLSNQLPSNDNVVQSSWCDYFLDCTPAKKCETNPEQVGCKAIQTKFDSAVSDPSYEAESLKYVPYRDDYRWRPNCTADGEYTPKQCKGPAGDERCVCVDPTGQRIFGEAFYFQDELFNDMNCACSRKVWERKNAGETTVTLHCYPNGNYEPLQCEDDYCYCVDPATAEPYGPNFPEAGMSKLPCYNEKDIGQQYLRRCESLVHAHTVLSDLLQAKNVQPPSTSVNCDEDGSYGPIQNNGFQFTCVDKYNNYLFAPPGGRCQCARDGLLFGSYSIAAPQCYNGTYEPKQTSGGTTYCVDDDGIRSGPLVYVQYGELLVCTNAKLCQEGYARNCNSACFNCKKEYYANYKPEEVDTILDK